MNGESPSRLRAFAIISGITAVLGGGLALVSNASSLVPDPGLHEDWTLLLLVAVGLYGGLKIYTWTMEGDPWSLLFAWGPVGVLTGFYLLEPYVDWEVLCILVPMYASALYITWRHIRWWRRQRRAR